MATDDEVIALMDMRRDLQWYRRLRARANHMTLIAWSAKYVEWCGLWLLFCGVCAGFAGVGFGPSAAKGAAILYVFGCVGTFMFVGKAEDAEREWAKAASTLAERHFRQEELPELEPEVALLVAHQRRNAPEEDDEPGGDIDWGDGGPLGAS